MPPKRMTANPLRPARHRLGKPAAAAAASSSSDEDSDEEDPAPQDDAPTTSKPKPKPAAPSTTAPSTTAPSTTAPPSLLPKSTVHLSTSLKNVDLARDGALRPGALSDAQRKTLEDEFETESSEGSEEEDGGDGSSSEEDSDEEEESSSSEDERRRKLLLRPVFMKKNASGRSAAAPAEEDAWAQDAAKEQAKKDAAIEAQAQQYALERAEEKTSWDDDERTIAAEIDDGDGRDPEAERTAWKLRELRRLKRERDALVERERERDEVERRRNLTVEEREAEDAEHLAAQHEEREGRGKMGFRQRYFHKGAFFADDAKAAGLADRDVMGGRYEDDVVDKSALPEFMQMRDMARLGKKGRTRYKDLKTEDTGRFGDAATFRGRGAGRGDQAVDERFRADYDGGGMGATGANASVLGERKRMGSVDRRDVKRSRVESQT